MSSNISTRAGERKKRPSARGKRAFFMVIIELGLLVFMLIASALTAGTSIPLFGGLGLVLMIYAVISLILALRGLREKNATYGQCRVAIVLNVVILSFLIALFIRGAQ